MTVAWGDQGFTKQASSRCWFRSDAWTAPIRGEDLFAYPQTNGLDGEARFGSQATPENRERPAE